MLVLLRKEGEGVVIGDMVVRVLEVRGSRVKLGFDSPTGQSVVREEVWLAETKVPDVGTTV